MIGRVSSELVPLLTVRVSDTNEAPFEIEVTVDTGFNGELTLPPETLESLNSRAPGSRRLRIGNGSWVWLSTHEVELEWDGNPTWVTCLSDSKLPSFGDVRPTRILCLRPGDARR